METEKRFAGGKQRVAGMRKKKNNLLKHTFSESSIMIFNTLYDHF